MLDSSMLVYLLFITLLRALPLHPMKAVLDLVAVANNHDFTLYLKDNHFRQK